MRHGGGVILYLVSIFIVIKGNGNLQTAFGCIFIFAFGARNIDFHKIAGITVMVGMSLFTFVVISSLVGIIPNYHSTLNNRSRYFLGFRYALNAPALLTNIILLLAYYKKSKIKISEILIFFLINLTVFKATNARLSFLVSIVGLAVALINKFRKDDFNKLKLLPRLLVSCFAVCGVMSVWLVFTYSAGVTWMRELDDFLGHRLRLGHNSILMYGIHWFGSGNIEWIGNGLDMYGNPSTKAYLYVDNLYIQVLQRYGIVFIALFLILTTVLMMQCYRKNEHLLVILLSIIAMHGLIDDSFLYLHYNTFWLLVGSAIFGYIRDRRVEKPVRRRRHTNHVKM